MKNGDEAKKALQRYKAEQDKLFDDLRNELNFQKADRREREREAKLLIDKLHKLLVTELSFPVERMPEPEMIPQRAFERLGFTIDEARELTISHLKCSGKLPENYKDD